MYRLIYYIYWNKKIGRREFWTTFIGNSLFFIIFLFSGILLLGSIPQAEIIFKPIFYLVFLYCLLVTLAAYASRCNDVKLNLWHLIWIVPLGPFSTIFLGLLPTKK